MANIFKSKYTGEQIEEILDKSNKVSDITPNPEAEATDDLNTITIGGTTYRIPTGTSVEANPSADATEELTKLKIGDTVFSIPQGGGGGVEYKYEIIFNINEGQRKYYFTSPYILNSYEDIIANYSVPTGKNCIALYGNGGGFSLANTYFLAYLQVEGSYASIYYFNIQRVDINGTYVYSTTKGSTSRADGWFVSITRLA